MPDPKYITLTVKKSNSQFTGGIETIGTGIIIDDGSIEFNVNQVGNTAMIANVKYGKINLQAFPLENLDEMRENILKNTGANTEFIIDKNTTTI